MGREFPKLVTLVNLLGDNFVYLSSVYKCITDPFLSREKFYMTHWRRSQGREYMQVLRLTLRWVEVPGVVTVYLISRVWLFAIPGTAACQAFLSCLLRLMSFESVMPSKHLILCHPLLLPPSVFPSIRVFSNELVLHIRWPKYWSFSFSIHPSNEYSGLISFRMDWFDHLDSLWKRFLKQHEGWKWQG